MTITLTEALSKLKLLDKKIEKKTEELRNKYLLVDYTKGKNNLCINSNKSIKEFEIDAQAVYQSLQSLIENRIKLKGKIAMANATTTVTIADKKYTIAEAIEMKNYINTIENVNTAIVAQYDNLKHKIINTNEKLQSKVDDLISSRLSSDAKTKDSDEIITLAKELYKKDELTLIDPLHIPTLVKTATNDIENFKTNVDVALSIANATTTIELD